jgi:hypothetical protein
LYTYGAYIYDSSLWYYAGTIAKWPKPSEGTPYWGFIATETFPSVINRKITASIKVDTSYPAVSMNNDKYTGTNSWRDIDAYVRVISYTTNDISTSYPTNVLNNDGFLTLSHNASSSYTVQMGVDCIYVSYSRGWPYLLAPTFAELKTGFTFSPAYSTSG